MNNKRYSSDLTDGEWNHVKRLIPKAKPGGRPRELNMREVLNGIFYLVCGGIPWELLPKDFPKWKSVYHYFRLWRLQGRWKAIHDRLRGRLRQKQGGRPSPSAAIIHSQSVKPTESRGASKWRSSNASPTSKALWCWPDAGWLKELLAGWGVHGG